MLSDLTTINISDLDGSKLDNSRSEGPTQSTQSARKRTLVKEEAEGEMTLTSKDLSKDLWEERSRRAKKFRVEWMNEVYFKDWLRPHPTDETYCICIACDIRLRCGKSELEKHASGMKHCKRMEVMKENPNSSGRLSILTEGSSAQAADNVLCEENGTFYVAAGGDHIERLEDSYDTRTINCEDSTGTTRLMENTITKALDKLDKYLDGKSEMDKKKFEMLEAEHQSRMLILNKELELRSLEILVKQEELQKLKSHPSVDDVKLLL